MGKLAKPLVEAKQDIIHAILKMNEGEFVEFLELLADGLDLPYVEEGSAEANP